MRCQHSREREQQQCTQTAKTRYKKRTAFASVTIWVVYNKRANNAPPPPLAQTSDSRPGGVGPLDPPSPPLDSSPSESNVLDALVGWLDSGM